MRERMVAAADPPASVMEDSGVCGELRAALSRNGEAVQVDIRLTLG